MDKEYSTNLQQSRKCRSREKIAARAASLAPSRELLNRLGETFRPLQEEAWLDYCARQAEMDAQAEA